MFNEQQNNFQNKIENDNNVYYNYNNYNNYNNNMNNGGNFYPKGKKNYYGKKYKKNKDKKNYNNNNMNYIITIQI